MKVSFAWELVDFGGPHPNIVGQGLMSKGVSLNKFVPGRISDLASFRRRRNLTSPAPVNHKPCVE